jgi:hypothetical protein
MIAHQVGALEDFVDGSGHRKIDRDSCVFPAVDESRVFEIQTGVRTPSCWSMVGSWTHSRSLTNSACGGKGKDARGTVTPIRTSICNSPICSFHRVPRCYISPPPVRTVDSRECYFSQVFVYYLSPSWPRWGYRFLPALDMDGS